jgi:hypothetical protein
MADVRISALPLPGTIVPASDVLPLVNGGNTTKVTPAAITTAALNATKVTVAQGGTGVGTLTGYVKGNGTANMTASTTVAITDLNFNVPGTPPTIDGRTSIIVNTGSETSTITLDQLKTWLNS